MSSDPNASTPPDYRTPIARARGLGSGKTGTGHFWWQRVTAVALVPLVAWFIGTVLSLVGADLATVYATLSRPWTAILFAVFAIAMFWHAKLGLQVIIEDYVHAHGLAIAAQLAVRFICALAAIASVLAVVRIALGAV
jgi:succinate dehydrogenase / fumarate reductase membrane anchor subunit